MIKTVFKNRYTLLLAVLTCYLLAVVAEGMITGRDPNTVDINNPFFDVIIPDFERLTEDSPRQRADEPDEPAPPAEPASPVAPAEPSQPDAQPPAAAPAPAIEQQPVDPQTPGSRA